METLTAFVPLFTAGIFFIGFLALLLTGFNSLLNAKIEPLKENQARFDGELKEIKGKLDQLLAKS